MPESVADHIAMAKMNQRKGDMRVQAKRRGDGSGE
jgi:hypothetical protein